MSASQMVPIQVLAFPWPDASKAVLNCAVTLVSELIHSTGAACNVRLSAGCIPPPPFAKGVLALRPQRQRTAASISRHGQALFAHSANSAWAHLTCLTWTAAASLGTITETQPQEVRRVSNHFSALSTALGVSPSPTATPAGPLTQSLHQSVEPAPLA